MDCNLKKIRFAFIKFPSRGNAKSYLFIFDLLCYPSGLFDPKAKLPLKKFIRLVKLISI